MNLKSYALIQGFRQSAPYVNAHRSKTFVLLLSGEAIAHKNFKNIINDIALLNNLGIKIVLVFGARPQIEQRLQEQDIQATYHNNIRVTDEDTLKIVKQVSGEVQLDIMARLSMSLHNTPMANSRTNVVAGNFILAQPIGIEEGVDYCHSGKLRRIDVLGIQQQLQQNAIVLIGPLAGSVTGEGYNLQTEELAAQLASKLKAEKLIGFCADLGVLDSEDQIISEMLPEDVTDFLHARTSPDQYDLGTLLFLKNALKASHAGVPRSHLISYQEDGALIQELFSINGIGTQIVMASSEQTRQATIQDIGGILDLIRPLEQEGILVRRSREQLEQEIPLFSVIEKEDHIIGCAALYPFPKENMAEMACVAISPEFRNGDRGVTLLKHIKKQARAQKIKTLFVLTTKSLHWFKEQGFHEISLHELPEKKQKLYNFQRKSKMLALDLSTDKTK